MLRLTTLLPLALLGCAPHTGSEPTRTNWSEARTPCNDTSTSVVETDSTGTTWCGCGADESGLYARPADEEEFDRIEGFDDVNVLDFSLRGDGALFIAGTSGGSEIAMSVTGDMLDLSVDTLLTADSPIDLGSASDIAVESDGEIRAMDASGTVMAWYDGIVWVAYERWTTDYETGHVMTSLRSDGDVSFGVGTNPEGSPTVYLPAPDALNPSELESVSFASLDMRFSDVARVEGAFYAFGEAASDASPAILECSTDCSNTESWSRVGIDEALQLDDEYAGLSEVAFDATGTYGIAIGERITDGASEGYALVSSDAGVNWTLVTDDFPSLDACTAGEGTFTVTGEAGYLATGEIR